jgi:hypothetical protein
MSLPVPLQLEVGVLGRTRWFKFSMLTFKSSPSESGNSGHGLEAFQFGKPRECEFFESHRRVPLSRLRGVGAGPGPGQRHRS